MHRQLIGAAVALAAAVSAHSQTDDSLATRVARCAAVKSEILRLQCYDALVQKPEPERKWKIGSVKDAIHGTPIDYVYQTAGDSLDAVSLVVRCEDRTLQLLFNSQFGVHLRYGEKLLDAVYRLDEEEEAQPVAFEVWQGEFFGFFDTMRSAVLLNRLLKSKMLAIRFSKFGDSTITARFDLMGLDEVLAPLRTRCAW